MRPSQYGLKFTTTEGDETVQQVSAEEGQVLTFDFYNPNAAVAYVQWFDKLAANVTLGTTVADWYTVIPGVGGRDWSCEPIPFNTAISFAVTTTATGLTALAADCVMAIKYE